MTDNQNHTPGPWKAIGTAIYAEDDGSDQEIVWCYYTDDAPLVAAAPDLLDALQFALDSEDVTLGDGGSILGDDIREYIKQAIAKAKGE